MGSNSFMYSYKRAETDELNNWAEISCVMKRMVMGLLLGVASILTMMITVPMTANAGEPPTAERCYDTGFIDGQDNPFSATTYQECDTESKFVDGQNQYEAGFLDGCMSVEGNTRDACENAIE
jgi:hypothetical protein